MDFDIQAEAATEKLRVLPGCYIRVNGKSYSPDRMAVTGKDGKTRMEWDYSGAEVWVPPEMVEEFTTVPEAERKRGIRPMAVHKGSRERKVAWQDQIGKDAPPDRNELADADAKPEVKPAVKQRRKSKEAE